MITNKNTPATAARTPKPPVLVTCEWDGWIQVFGNVDARLVMVPEVPADAGHFYNAAGEIEAEHFIESTLPERHRKIFTGGLLSAADKIEVLRPRDVARRQIMAELMRVQP